MKSFSVLVLIFVFVFPVSLFAQDITVPATPRGFDASGGATGFELVLTWTNPADEDLDHVNVYFSPTGAFSSSGVWATVAAQPNTKGSATIGSLSTGTNYYVYIAALDTSGNISPFTEELKRTTAAAVDSTSPAAVTDFLATDLATGGAVKLSWTNPVDDDFFQVRLHRSTVSEFTPSSENEIATVFGTSLTVAEYSDSGLTNDQIYYYKIRSEDNRDNIQSGLFYPSASATPTFVEPEPEAEPEPDPIPSPDVDTSGVLDGDLITTADSFDIYIVKLVGDKKFKRLILNPAIFDSYGHLKWEDVKTISQEVQDVFTLSELAIEVNDDGSVADPKVYKVSSATGSDVGQRQWLDLTAAEFEMAGYDWDAIYHINHVEASVDFYPLGPVITAL